MLDVLRRKSASTRAPFRPEPIPRASRRVGGRFWASSEWKCGVFAPAAGTFGFSTLYIIRRKFPGYYGGFHQHGSFAPFSWS